MKKLKIVLMVMVSLGLTGPVMEHGTLLNNSVSIGEILVVI